MKRKKVTSVATALAVGATAVFLIGGTYSRYSTSGTQTTNANIAKWNVALKNGEGKNLFKETRTIDFTVEPNTNVVNGKFAPGSSASTVFELDLTGTEVAVDFKAKLGEMTQIINNKVTLTAKISSDETFPDDNEKTKEFTLNNSAAYIPLESGSAFTAENGKKYVKLTLNWENDDENNVADTTMGETAGTISVPVTITVQQHIGNVTTLLASATAADLSTALGNAAEGDTIKLSGDIALANYLEISKGITIDGNGHTITAKDASVAAIEVTTDAPVVLKNVKLSNGKYGIEATTTSPHVTVYDSEITLTNSADAPRGIIFSNGNISDAELTVSGVKLAVDSVNGDGLSGNTSTKGIVISKDCKNSAINIENSSIAGGIRYAVDLGSMAAAQNEPTNASAELQVNNFAGTTVNVKNSNFSGRAGLNIWSDNATVNVTNCSFGGINPYSGDNEYFADIVVNQTADNNKIYIESSNFTPNSPSDLQYMLALRGEQNKVYISGNTTYTSYSENTKSILEDSHYIHGWENETRGAGSEVVISGGRFKLNWAATDAEKPTNNSTTVKLAAGKDLQETEPGVYTVVDNN